MARLRRKPTWAELKQAHVLIVHNGTEHLALSQVNNYLIYLRNQYNCVVEIPQELKQKQYWTETDFEKLRIPEIILESRSHGDDGIDIGIIRSFAR